MKSNSAHDRQPPRLRSRADRLEVAIVVNQLATPGLGSWMAGHRTTGAGQLVIASAGFAGSLVHWWRSMRAIWTAAGTGAEAVLPDNSLLMRSLVLFGIAWIWAGFTSLQIYAEIRRLRAAPPTQPPSLDPSAPHDPPR